MKKLTKKLKKIAMPILTSDKTRALKLNREVRKSINKCKSVKQSNMETIITTDFLHALTKQLKQKGKMFCSVRDEPFNGADFYICLQEKRKDKREIFIHFQVKVLQSKYAYKFKSDKKSSLIGKKKFLKRMHKYVLTERNRNLNAAKYSALVARIRNGELTQMETQYFYSSLSADVLPLYLFFIDWENYSSQSRKYNYSNAVFTFTELLVKKKFFLETSTTLNEIHDIVFDFRNLPLSKRLFDQKGYFFFGKNIDLIYHNLVEMKKYANQTLGFNHESSEMSFKILENSNKMEELLMSGARVLRIEL